MLTHDDIARVLAYYDVGELRSSRPASHGAINETAFIETTVGRFVIRRNRRHIGFQSIKLRHRLLDWLRQRGFPAPRVLPARNGDTVVILNDRVYELSVFIIGDEFNPSRPRQLSDIGRVLASYHRAVTGFPDPPPPPPPRYLPSSLSSLTERLITRDLLGDLTVTLHWYERRIADLRRQLSDEAYAALPHVLIHGDIHRDNLIFRGDAVAALIDYDQIGIDARLVDVADGLVDMAVGPPPPNWSMWGVYRAPLDLERVQLFLSAYNAIAPLSKSEAQALPAILEVIWLQGNLRRTLSTPDAEPDYHLELLGQGQWLSEWMDRHREHVLAAAMVY
ncbi:homoserine kinase [Chloroflexus islandicus]|uniref:Homoserine kinase n=1 Tax=Chloroflexus islandicus TaxID=1707952 RepID=A0A178M5H5_9CHLR|nr:homoserine kinase [Chloroflexus islandicus]OAN43813.1 homoserine kinase [Chloroflexus islandicus]